MRCLLLIPLQEECVNSMEWFLGNKPRVRLLLKPGILMPSKTMVPRATWRKEWPSGKRKTEQETKESKIKRKHVEELEGLTSIFSICNVGKNNWMILFAY